MEGWTLQGWVDDKKLIGHTGVSSVELFTMSGGILFWLRIKLQMLFGTKVTLVERSEKGC